MKTIEELIDEGNAVVEYPGGYIVSRTRTIYRLENGRLKAEVLSGDDYNALCLFHSLSFLFQCGFKLPQLHF